MYNIADHNQGYDRWKTGSGYQYYMGPGYFDQTENTKEQRTMYNAQVEKNEDSDSLDSEGKQRTFGKLCERFAEKTSMQGIPYINAAKLKYAKVLWVIILLIGMAGMTLHLYYLINQFFDYEVQVSISLGFSNLAFPAVTICNVNAIRNSQLHKTPPKLQLLVSKTDPDKLAPPGSSTGKGLPGPKKRRKRNTKLQEFDINFDDFAKDYDSAHREGEKDETFQIEDTFKTLYMNMSGGLRKEIGHQIQDMLLQCTFDGYKCFDYNFTLVQTEKYGNCYQIQSDNFIVTNPGPKHGLTLTLYMETGEYLSGISQALGARVLIHGKDTYPFPATEGLYVSSSFETHIGLKQVEVIRKGHPYGDCEDVLSFKQKYGAKYTRTLCQFFCVQDLIIQQCGCFDIQSSNVYKMLNFTQEVDHCQSMDEHKCLAEFKAKLRAEEPGCPQCVNPCREFQYETSLSSRNWPTDKYANVLMSDICKQIPGKCDEITDFNDNDDLAGLAKNFVKIVVYFVDLNYELIEEKPEIESQQFASDVGGAIGLWIGLSLISIFEIMQLFLECCAFCVHKSKTPARGEPFDKYGQYGRNYPNEAHQIIKGNVNPFGD